MDGLFRSIRLLLGLVMLAAGTILAAPTAITLARWWQETQAAPVAQSPLSAQPTPPTAWIPPAAPGPPAAPPPGWHVAPAGPAAAVAAGYRPPEPPAPLPPTAFHSAGQSPELSSAYRSTLAVPPPPLIDGQRPPPVAVGWTARFARDQASRPAHAPPPAASYRVRDGDDLTGIATRFYGTPAAATIIWQANRSSIPDPGVLPIGVELVLPRPDAAGVHGVAIDPALGQPGLPAAPPMPPAAAWLDAAS